jgi:hypothetical protein
MAAAVAASSQPPEVGTNFIEDSAVQERLVGQVAMALLEVSDPLEAGMIAILAAQAMAPPEDYMRLNALKAKLHAAVRSGQRVRPVLDFEVYDARL